MSTEVSAQELASFARRVQHPLQVTALKVHAQILRVASFVWTPVRLLQEQIDGTAMFRDYNARA